MYVPQRIITACITLYVPLRSIAIIEPLLNAEQRRLPEWVCWTKHVELVTMAVQHSISRADLTKIDKLVEEHSKLFDQVQSAPPLTTPPLWHTLVRLCRTACYKSCNKACYKSCNKACYNSCNKACNKACNDAHRCLIMLVSRGQSTTSSHTWRLMPGNMGRHASSGALGLRPSTDSSRRRAITPTTRTRCCQRWNSGRCALRAG